MGEKTPLNYRSHSFICTNYLYRLYVLGISEELVVQSEMHYKTYIPFEDLYVCLPPANSHGFYNESHMILLNTQSLFEKIWSRVQCQISPSRQYRALLTI